MNLLYDKQLFNKVPFQSTKYRKNEKFADNIKTIGAVFCPTCRNEKSVYISTNKTTSFYDCKKCNACWHVLNILSRTMNQRICCLVVTKHIVLQKRVVVTTKKKSHLIFEEVSPPIITKHIRTWTKKRQIKSKYGISVSFSFRPMIWATDSFFKSFYSISIYS